MYCTIKNTLKKINFNATSLFLIIYKINSFEPILWIQYEIMYHFLILINFLDCLMAIFVDYSVMFCKELP